jgi:hypothetical protein
VATQVQNAAQLIDQTVMLTIWGFGFRIRGLGCRDLVLKSSVLPHFFFFFITLGPEMSDTKVYEP